MKIRDYVFLVFVLSISVLLLSLVKFTAWPEMIAWPYLILEGWLPYRDIAIAHNPLLLVDLSLFFKLFGVGIVSLKVFTWILILASNILIFFVVNDLWGKKTAFASLIIYDLWLMVYEGNGVWFDFYMGIFAFVSFYFIKKKDFFWAGVFWALAFLAKQTAFWFLLPIIFEIVRLPLKDSPLKVGKMIIGSAVVFGLFLSILLSFGILDDWWQWAVHFGIFVLPRSQGQIQFPDLKTFAVSFFPFLIFLPLFFNLKLSTISRRSLAINHQSSIINLFFWSFAGSLGVYPRFELFHFQPSLFYLAIAFALVFSKFVKSIKPLRIFLVAFLLGNIFLFARFVIGNFEKETRFYEKDLVEAVSFIRQETSPGDYILVLNWWDNLYALTNTLPAVRPLVPQLAWYQEREGVQEREVESLSENKPKFVVLNPYTEYGLSSYIPREVYNYVIANYKLKHKIGGIEILSPKE